MLKDIKSLFYQEKLLKKLLVVEVLFFPVIMLTGNLLINLFILIIAITFLANIIIDKKNNIFSDNFFYILLLFWFTLLINLIFTQNLELSYPRVLKFIVIIFFIFGIKYLINYSKNKFESLIYKFWTIIFGIVLFDLIFQYIFGFNTFGFKSYMPGRLSSFLNDELVIGYFFSGFVLFFLTFLFYKKVKNQYLILLSLSLIIISFLIGERSNFIKSFIIILFFNFYVLNYSFLKKIFFTFTLGILLFLIIISNENYKNRYFDQVSTIYGINKFFNESRYGEHYKNAYDVYKNYKIFGVGIKNFREETAKKIYSKNLVATHPHQLHLEFLAETGLFGYISFLLFIFYSLTLSIKNFLKSKNYYQLSSILFILISLIPLLPSGSFFTTYSILFWINYSIMIAYNKNIKF